MSRPKRDRWLTLDEVIALVAERYPTLLALRRKAQRQRIRRIVQRAEQRDRERYSRIHGNELVVSRNALESLLPYDAKVFTNLERDLAQLAQNHRQLKRQVNGHGAQLRQLHEQQRLTTEYLAAMQATKGVRKAS